VFFLCAWNKKIIAYQNSVWDDMNFMHYGGELIITVFFLSCCITGIEHFHMLHAVFRSILCYICRFLEYNFYHIKCFPRKWWWLISWNMLFDSGVWFLLLHPLWHYSFYLILLLCFTGEYSQEIPANKPWEKVSGPPILPPHLLQVILNKDTPLSVSTNILL